MRKKSAKQNKVFRIEIHKFAVGYEIYAHTPKQSLSAPMNLICLHRHACTPRQWHRRRRLMKNRISLP